MANRTTQVFGLPSDQLLLSRGESTVSRVVEYRGRLHHLAMTTRARSRVIRRQCDMMTDNAGAVAAQPNLMFGVAEIGPKAGAISINTQN